MHLDTFYARTPEGIVAYDFQETNDRHYVTPTYGPPAPWPAHIPSAVRPTPYYGFGPAEGTPLRGATIMVRPRGQETPVRTNVSLMGLGADPEKPKPVRGVLEYFAAFAKESPTLTTVGMITIAIVAIVAAKSIGRIAG